MALDTQPSRHLADPIIVIDIENTLREIKLQNPWQNKGHNAKTILKHNDLQIVLIAMKKGTQIPQHDTNSSITIHNLEGYLQIQTPHQCIDLKKGQLLALDPSISHNIHAVEESFFLLSIAGIISG